MTNTIINAAIIPTIESIIIEGKNERINKKQGIKKNIVNV